MLASGQEVLACWQPGMGVMLGIVECHIGRSAQGHNVYQVRTSGGVWNIAEWGLSPLPESAEGELWRLMLVPGRA